MCITVYVCVSVCVCLFVFYLFVCQSVYDYKIERESVCFCVPHTTRSVSRLSAADECVCGGGVQSRWGGEVPS